MSVKGRDLTAKFRGTLEDIQTTPERIYTVATNEYIANKRLETDIGSGKTTANMGCSERH
ncbi:MAG: hypothetical protein ACI9HY_002049 [Planctomycetaceae bacterium]